MGICTCLLPKKQCIWGVNNYRILCDVIIHPCLLLAPKSSIAGGNFLPTLWILASGTKVIIHTLMAIFCVPESVKFQFHPMEWKDISCCGLALITIKSTNHDAAGLFLHGWVCWPIMVLSRSVQWPMKLLLILDYCTVSLHSPNGRQFACHSGCAMDCQHGQWPLKKNNGNSHQSQEPSMHWSLPRMHWPLVIPSLHLE